MLKHKHHIIPKHMGGDNSPDNIIELTVPEHAEAHRLLYEKHGKWQDFLAWKALSSQIDTDEIRRLITSLTWTGKKHTDEAKEKIKKARSKQKSGGWSWSKESKDKRSKALIGRKHSDNTKKKMSDALLGRNKPKIECPHCGKIGGVPQMHQWHFDKCKERII